MSQNSNERHNHLQKQTQFQIKDSICHIIMATDCKTLMIGTSHTVQKKKKSNILFKLKWISTQFREHCNYAADTDSNLYLTNIQLELRNFNSSLLQADKGI